MSRNTCLLLMICAVLVVAGCERGGSSTASDKVPVFVSIVPQEYFVERIGGQHVAVEALVQPGQTPHSFSPTTAQMARLAESAAYFRIGIPFEDRVMRKIAAANPLLKVVDTHKGIKFRKMMTHEEAEGHDEHGDHDGHKDHKDEKKKLAKEHDDDGHDHEGHDHDADDLDPHIWLNPRNVKIMAKAICDTLKELDPDHAPAYTKNLEAFLHDLDAMDQKLAKSLGKLTHKEFMVFHPAFGYFGDAYGLKQIPVEIEGKQPTARNVVRLIEKARAKGIKVIFVQPQFSPKRAEAVAKSIGGVVVPMDPLSRDYMTNLDHMCAQVEGALK